MRFLTAGESHGPALTAIIEGLPAGLCLNVDRIDQMLVRRQQGVGSSNRMEIESDKVSITSGLRHGETLGSPLAITIQNRDWENWKEIMDPWQKPRDVMGKRTVPRPGHADLAGMIKYKRADARDILERASARETAIRTAVGAICKELLFELDVDVSGYVISIGEVSAKTFDCGPESSPVRCPDKEASLSMTKLIEQAKLHGETLGGIIEVKTSKLPVGLGSHVHWDRRLDSRIAGAMMSVPAIKGVEIGLGFEATRRVGSQVMDSILPGFKRSTNHMGGVEGGISNGEPIVVRCGMKPLPTVRRPVPSIDMETGNVTGAATERSDVCAVPRAAVVCEAVLAIELARVLVERFGGDTLWEIKERVQKNS
ncbi:chorismate synthase [Bdellovibrionota bacterium]